MTAKGKKETRQIAHSDARYGEAQVGRRRFLTIGAAGLASLGAPFLWGCSQAHPPPVRRFYRPRHNTIAHEIIAIENENGAGVGASEAYLLLDMIIDTTARNLARTTSRTSSAKERALTSLETVHRMLRSCGYKYQSISILSDAIQRGGINCDTTSAIYLAVGETLNLPIRMVRAPAHTFVRWHFGDSDNSYLNWETTTGSQQDDEYYIKRFNIDPGTMGKSAMRSMDVQLQRSEILANAHVNCGVTFFKQCRLNLAIGQFEEAIRRDPVYDTPHYNLALAYYQANHPLHAIASGKIALSLNPNHVKTHSVMRNAYLDLGKPQHARFHEKRILSLDPDYYSLPARRKRHAAAPVCNT